MKRLFSWGVIFFCIHVSIFAQSPDKIKIQAKNTPLSQVLLDLKDTHGFQFAFDSDLLSEYSISVNQTFANQESALQFLIKNLPLEIEKSGDVYIIFPKEEEEELPVFTTLSGHIIESLTYEPLPFSNVTVNETPVRADQNGYFRFIASAYTTFEVQISHLGYFRFDTIVAQGLNRRFVLTPRMEQIKEIQVLSNPVENSTLIGDRAGRMKINHQIAPILPGHGDNSVFNLLRLMPGVMAAGEQSNDLIIWGAYESHSKIEFDGYTIFGLKNFNDNISVVNPYMVKNIEVMKGGYEALHGGRVGGIIDIQGRDGALNKPTLSATINSTTLNAMLQLPVSKKSSLTAAYRQTYYSLYDPTVLRFSVPKVNNSNNGNNDNSNNGNGNDNSNNGNGNGNEKSNSENSGNAASNASENAKTTSLNFDIKPDYEFRDANLKYSYRGDNGSRFAISAYGGGDSFSYDTDAQRAKTVFSRREKETNDQIGVSAQYSLPWSGRGKTNVQVSYSNFEQQIYDDYERENTKTGTFEKVRDIDLNNNVTEAKAKLEHQLFFEKSHRLWLGASAVQNAVELSRTSEDEALIDFDNEFTLLTAYAQDELSLGNVANFKAGIRANYASNLKKWYVEPRLSVSLNISEEVKLNASWGMYNQFVSKTLTIDSLGQLSYFWLNAGDYYPVLEAQHLVGGLSFNNEMFAVSAEGYYKTTDGITRFFGGNERFQRGLFVGNSRSYGVDVHAKWQYKRNMFWVSYTLSQTEEHFDFYVRDTYKPAPHHQKHELKCAGVFNYKSLYLSANYVHGSGFERFDVETADGELLNKAYNRVDASLVYKFKPGKIKAEAGISVLNLLDANNLKYSNLRVNTTQQSDIIETYSDAVPFTPALFLKVEL